MMMIAVNHVAPWSGIRRRGVQRLAIYAPRSRRVGGAGRRPRSPQITVCVYARYTHRKIPVDVIASNDTPHMRAAIKPPCGSFFFSLRLVLPLAFSISESRERSIRWFMFLRNHVNVPMRRSLPLRSISYRVAVSCIRFVAYRRHNRKELARSTG